LADIQHSPQRVTGGAQGTVSSSGSDTNTIGSHTYVNYTELKRDINQINESQAEVIQAVIHQESLEDEIMIVANASSPSYPYPPGDEILPYPDYLQDNLHGDESPPLDCNKSLITSEPRHTM